MRRDPARDVNADSCDLAAPGVNAGQALDSKSIDTEVRHGPDQHFFQIANVAMNVFAIGAEIDNRVTNDLAQAVISHFSAAIRLKQRHTPRSKFLFVEQD